MTWFPTPISHKIFCSFRDNQKADVEISEDTYNSIRELWPNALVTIESKWKIQFEWNRREIQEFKHIYPNEDTKPDEYKLYSAEYLIEKEKRNKFYKSLKLSKDETDIIRSIILARWGKSYKGAKWEEWWDSWKAYFKWMFPIIALERNGYKDKISSKEWIINKWKKELEIPEMFENLEVYREFVKA